MGAGEGGGKDTVSNACPAPVPQTVFLLSDFHSFRAERTAWLGAALGR